MLLLDKIIPQETGRNSSFRKWFSNGFRVTYSSLLLENLLANFAGRPLQNCRLFVGER